MDVDQYAFDRFHRLLQDARRLRHWVELPRGLGPSPEWLAEQLSGELIRWPSGDVNIWCFSDEQESLDFATRFGGKRSDVG